MSKIQIGRVTSGRDTNITANESGDGMNTIGEILWVQLESLAPGHEQEIRELKSEIEKGSDRKRIQELVDTIIKNVPRLAPLLYPMVNEMLKKLAMKPLR